MGRRLVFDLEAALIEHFKQPRVIERERGVIPGCYPMDIQYYHTKADDPNEWLNWLHPNAARLPIRPKSRLRVIVD